MLIVAAAVLVVMSRPVASSQFGVYLFRREETGQFGFSGDSWTHSACVFRRGLQQLDSRADQTDAAGRSLFGFTLRQNPPPILGSF